MDIAHNGHNNTIHIYSVTVMTHVVGLEDGQSSLGHLSLLHRYEAPPVAAFGMKIMCSSCDQL